MRKEQGRGRWGHGELAVASSGSAKPGGCDSRDYGWLNRKGSDARILTILRKMDIIVHHDRTNQYQSGAYIYAMYVYLHGFNSRFSLF